MPSSGLVDNSSITAALWAVTLVETRAQFSVGSVRVMRTHNGMPGRMRRTGGLVSGSGFCHSAEQLSAVDNVPRLGPVVHTPQVLERIGVA